MDKELSFQLSLSGNFQSINFPKDSSPQNSHVVVLTGKDRIDMLSGMLSGENIIKKNEFIDIAAEYLISIQELLSSCVYQVMFIREGILSPRRPDPCPFSVNGFPVKQEWRPMPENIVNGFLHSYELSCPEPAGTLEFDDIIEFLRLTRATVLTRHSSSASPTNIFYHN